MNLICNVRSCRKVLTGVLWVTSCSHCFCNDHASPQKNMKCPVCNILLVKRFDVVKQDSNPSEGYKAMLLVGLRPEVVLDMAMRAVSFWTSQVDQELKTKSNSTKQLQGAAEKMKGHYDIVLKQLEATKKTINSHEKIKEDLMSTIKHLKDKLASKDTQLQNMQHVLNAMKSKMNSIPRILADTDTKEFPPSQNDIIFEHVRTNHDVKRGENQPLNIVQPADFVFEPCCPPKRKHL